MAGGEPAEITALNKNMEAIVETVTLDQSTLQWFADHLVEKAFLPRQGAREILNTLGQPPRRHASKLIDSVYTKLRYTDKKRKWFDEFVNIFSTEAAYEDLVLALKRSVGSAEETPPTGSSRERAPDITPEDFAEFPSPNLLDLMELVGVDMRAKWREVGQKLGIPESDLDAYKHDYQGTQRCMNKVMSRWEEGMTSEYSWKKLAEALCSPTVSEKKRLSDLLKKLKEKHK